jgi:hypothetical protein
MQNDPVDRSVQKIKNYRVVILRLPPLAGQVAAQYNLQRSCQSFDMQHNYGNSVHKLHRINHRQIIVQDLPVFTFVL